MNINIILNYYVICIYNINGRTIKTIESVSATIAAANAAIIKYFTAN